MPFASFLRRSLLAAGLFGLLAGSCAASVEAADARQEVTIGLVDTFSPDFYIHTYAPTLDNLIEALPQYAFRSSRSTFGISTTTLPGQGRPFS